MMKTINEDELIGYIMRNADDSDLSFQISYEEVKAVLDIEHKFLKSKGLIEDEPIRPEVSI